MGDISEISKKKLFLKTVIICLGVLCVIVIGQITVNFYAYMYHEGIETGIKYIGIIT